MTRTVYVRDEEKGFIPKEEWEEINGKVPMRTKGHSQIMCDVEPFVSPIDGSVINSRPDLRNHNEKHGVTNIHDYSEGYFEKRGKEMSAEASGQTDIAKQERKELIDKTLTDYGV